MLYKNINKIYLDFFKEEKIEYFRSMPYESAAVINPRKLPQRAQSIVVFLVPYYYPEQERNVSLYAVSRDYHLLARELEVKLRERLCECFPDIAEMTHIFADNSPFSEVKLANDAYLGVRGRNGLLINEKYGSYVFIFVVTSPAELDISSDNLTDRSVCADCGRCVSACPTGALNGCGECMSALTQKKQLTDEQEDTVSSHKLVWGCDICQEVCPMNKGTATTPVDFFLQDRTPVITKELLLGMTKEQFGERAYAWRGLATILRNLDFHE